MNIDWDMIRTYSFNAGVVLENDVYFYTRLGNMSKLNLITGKISHLDNIQNAIGVSVRSMFNIGNELYRIDNDDERIKGITTPKFIELKEALQNGTYIQFAEEYKSYICVLYGNGQLFYNIDVISETYEYIDIKDICRPQGEKDFFIDYAGMHDDKLWIFVKDEMLYYDLNEWKLEKKAIPKELLGCRCVAWGGEYIYILNKNNQVYKWNIKEQEYVLLWQNETYLGKENCFINLHCCGTKIIILPWIKGKDIIVIDKDSGKAEIYSEYPEDFSYALPDPYKYGTYMTTEGYIYYSNRSSNYVLKISKYDGEISWLKPILPNTTPDVKGIKKNLNGLVMKEEHLSLKYYIRIIAEK